MTACGFDTDASSEVQPEKANASSGYPEESEPTDQQGIGDNIACPQFASIQLSRTSIVCSAGTDRFSQPSIGLHHGRRGQNWIDARVDTKNGEAEPVTTVGKASAHLDMTKMVTELYDGKASSWLPADIRRDREEILAHDKDRHVTEIGNDKAAGYGEMLIGDFINMLDHVGAHSGQRFYDLGSGLGALVLTAGLLGLDSTGIELVKQRHDQACEVVQLAEEQGVGQTHGSVNFVHGSFYDLDFSDADVLFINSVLFSDEMMQILSKKTKSMKHGSRIISYLSLKDVGRETKSEGTWFRQMKSISLKTTFSKCPWNLYMGVNRHNEPPDKIQDSAPSPSPDLPEVPC